MNETGRNGFYHSPPPSKKFTTPPVSPIEKPPEVQINVDNIIEGFSQLKKVVENEIIQRSIQAPPQRKSRQYLEKSEPILLSTKMISMQKQKIEESLVEDLDKLIQALKTNNSSYAEEMDLNQSLIQAQPYITIDGILGNLWFVKIPQIENSLLRLEETRLRLSSLSSDEEDPKIESPQVEKEEPIEKQEEIQIEQEEKINSSQIKVMGGILGKLKELAKYGMKVETGSFISKASTFDPEREKFYNDRSSGTSS